MSVKTSYVILRQIFENIIVNSINYSYNNSTININLKTTKEGVLFSCRDSGIGIPADDQKHIFSYFFRAANAAKIKSGTGLGLYIAKILTDIIDGKIWFDAATPKNTTFFVSIPIPKPPVAKSDPFQPGANDHDYQKYGLNGFSEV